MCKDSGDEPDLKHLLIFLDTNLFWPMCHCAMVSWQLASPTYFHLRCLSVPFFPLNIIMKPLSPFWIVIYLNLLPEFNVCRHFKASFIIKRMSWNIIKMPTHRRGGSFMIISSEISFVTLSIRLEIIIVLQDLMKERRRLSTDYH
jgi:hypothetical protein